MYLSLLFPLLATSLAAALPAPDPTVEKRACATQTPDIVLTFSASVPSINYPGIKMARSGGPGTNNQKAGITFSNIPNGATGCALHYALPAVTRPDQYVVPATGANNFDVYGVATPVSRTTTWANQPATTTKWASQNVPNYASGPFVTILLATTCDQAGSFLLQLSDWQQNAGSITIPQNPPTSGFYLTYNC